MAVAKAGLCPCEKAGTLIANIAYGPWQKAAYYHMICARGQELTHSLEPDGRLVMRFWQRRLVDTGKQNETRDEVVGSKARQQWLKEIPNENHMQLKGTKVAPSQWMSFQKAWDMWDPVLSTRGLVLATLCQDKGWITTDEDLFATTRCGLDLSGEKPDPKSKAAAVKGAKAKLEALKNRSANTITAATKLCADIDVINGIRIILLGSRPAWSSYNDLMDSLTTPQKCLEHVQAWSQSVWLRPLEKTLECLTDLDGLARCGIRTDFKTADLRELGAESPEVKYQDALAQRLGKFVDLVLETRCGSLAERSFYYPHKLAGLTSTKEAVVQSTMKEFQRDVHAWWSAQESNSCVCMGPCGVAQSNSPIICDHHT